MYSLSQLLILDNWRIPRYPRSPIENRNLWSNQFFETLQNLKSGLYFCLGNSFIRWRVFFLAIETAFEDVILSLVIADFCHRILAGDGNYLYANLWSNLLIAFSKSGAVFAAILSQKRWENPPEIPRHFASNKEIAQVVYDFSCISEEAASTVKSLSSVTAQELRSMPAYAYLTQYDQLILEKERDRVFNLRIHHQKFFPLFGFMFVSGMSTLLFPMAHWLYGTFGNPEITCILGFLGGLLYFTFSTAPKIGLSMLLQTLASELDPSGRILMFIATLLVSKFLYHVHFLDINSFLLLRRSVIFCWFLFFQPYSITSISKSLSGSVVEHSL